MPTLYEALRSSDLVVSAKDPEFGATGDGATDDTDALQAAIDYCIGTTGSYHGTFTGVASTGSSINKVLYLPPGIYRITDELTITKAVGFRMIGAGRFVSTIQQVTNSKAAIVSNGMARCHFEGITLYVPSASTAACFNASWDNTAGGNALQSNNFVDMDFNEGAIGLHLGVGGYMGSETLIQNCFFTSHSDAGVKTENYNALQTTIIGGNIAGCNYGVSVEYGSVAAIISTGFQDSAGYDIRVNNSANDTMVIIGCRSESVNFVILNNAPHVSIMGCVTTLTSEGNFLSAGLSPVSIESCVSVAGTIVNPGRLSVKNSSFGRTDWLADPLQNAAATIEIENVMQGATPNSAGDGEELTIKRQRRSFNGGSPNLIFNYESNDTVVKTGAYTLTAYDSGMRFSNTGATAIVPFALPSADTRQGDVYKFVVTDADGIRVTAVGGHTIKVNTTTSASGGKIESTVVGSAITLRCVSGTQWAAESSSGTWTVT